MANSIVWDNNPLFVPGEATPFGFYDNDIQFQSDAIKVSKFCAARLGYPSMDVEMEDKSFFACFEEAVTTYGNEVYLYSIRNNYLSLEGSLTSSTVNNTYVQPNNAAMIKIAENYGSEVGVGGGVEWYKGIINLSAGVQDYDMNAWASLSASLQPGDSIEIKEVFFENRPAIMRYFDPYVGTGYGSQQLLDAFNFGTQSPAINFMLMPLNFDIAVLQAIELNDTIRKSSFSFNIVNNKLAIFPIPIQDQHLVFRYVKTSEKYNIAVSGSGDNLVTDMSNVPYNNPKYTQINAPGRYWIFEYTLALAKELLAYIRGKYSIVQIPGSEVTLNQSDLLAGSLNEKASLIEKLRGDLDELSRKSQLQRKAEENDSVSKTLNSYPMPIFIG